MFSATVRDNVKLAAPDADDEACWQALRAAAADEFVNELSDGLDTVIGEKGVTLSGGRNNVSV